MKKIKNNPLIYLTLTCLKALGYQRKTVGNKSDLYELTFLTILYLKRSRKTDHMI